MMKASTTSLDVFKSLLCISGDSFEAELARIDDRRPALLLSSHNCLEESGPERAHLSTRDSNAVDLLLSGHSMRDTANLVQADESQLRMELDQSLRLGVFAVEADAYRRCYDWVRRNRGRAIDLAEVELGISIKNLKRIVSELLAAAISGNSPVDQGRTLILWLTINAGESLLEITNELPFSLSQAAEMVTEYNLVYTGPNFQSILWQGIVENSPEHLPRELQMVRLYALGSSLEEIGQRFHVTRERVRQIINNYTPWTTSDILQMRKKLENARRLADVQRALEWSNENPGATVAEGATTLKLSEDDLRTALGRRRLRFHEQESRKIRNTARSEEDLLNDLRAFYGDTGKTTSSAYRLWAKSHGVPGPQTIMNRFGSWNGATLRAGIKTEAPIERDRRHSDEDLWAAVVEGVQKGLTTVDEFESWLASISGAPSIGLVRNRLELSWNQLRQEALLVISGKSERDRTWVDRVTKPRDWSTFHVKQDPIELMREARLALGKNITMERYREWAQANKKLSANTLMRMSGMPWADLVELVGGIPNRKEKRIPDEELLAWLRAFLESDPSRLLARYDAWRVASAAPTSSTIASRFGGWEAAVYLAESGFMTKY